MKNIISYIAVLASLLVLGSCQKEIAQPELENPVGELEYETVTFDVAAPSGAQTKTSYGETVTFTPELMVAVYLKNQIGEKTEAKYLQNVTPEITRKSNTETEWTVSVSLVKNFTYDIVFWAQKAGSTYYTIDWEHATITADYSDNKVAANDVTRDAFYFCCENYNFSDHKKDIVPYEIELSRPFAQINLGASDYAALVELYNFVDKKGSDLKTSIKTATKSVPSVLHVLSGEADTEEIVEFAPAYTTPLVDNVINVKGTDATGVEVTKSYTLVGTNYIFANIAQTENPNPTVDFTLTFEYNDQSFDIEVPNVPYARNYQTNILGNFFTSDTKFNVVIKPGFNNPDEYVDENGNKIEQTQNEFAVEFPAATIPAEGGNVTFKVTGNVSWTVDVAGAKASKTSGTGEAEVTLTFLKNENTEDVDYTVSVTTEAEVAQKKFEATYTQAAAEIVTPEEPEETNEVLSFINWEFDGAKSWNSSYEKHTVYFTSAVVEFASANKQSGTITHCPVTKGGDVVVKMSEGKKLTSAKFNLLQWTTKTQTATLYYSTNNGTTWSSEPVAKSSNFSLESPLPEGTNALKLKFSSTSNQVAIESIEISYTE